MESLLAADEWTTAIHHSHHYSRLSRVESRIKYNITERKGILVQRSFDDSGNKRDRELRDDSGKGLSTEGRQSIYVKIGEVSP